MTGPTSPGDDVMSTAQHSPLVLYTLIAVLVVSGLAQAVPQVQKILGPLGKLLGGRADEAKRAALEADAELDRMKAAELDDLKAKITSLEKRLDDQDVRNRRHTQWDVQAQIALARAGIEIDDPPPLY